MAGKWTYIAAALLVLLVAIFLEAASHAQEQPLVTQQYYDQGVELYNQYGGKVKNIDKLRESVDALQQAADADSAQPHAKTMLSLVKAELKDANKKLNPDYWKMAFSVIGGLGIFLIGMRYMSDGMQAVAGQRMRRMINAVTDNRFMAVGVGTGVTCFVQSSSITTVIVVGMVNSGLMMLHQAIGVIMGANIGTTITGWILVLKIGKYGLPMLGIAAFFYLFSRKDRWRYIAMAIMGLGMVFFGLALMKDGFKPVRDVPTFHEAFLWFQADSFLGILKCVLVGSILTGIVQSSSATLGITIAIASQGVIGFETAAALVLGQNVGTTITAWLASLGTTTVAKRAAYFHIIFNVVGVIIVILIFPGYVSMVSNIVEHLEGVDPRSLNIEQHKDFGMIMTFAIASAHTIFNIVLTLAMMPLVRKWATLLERLIPDKAVKETPHLTNLDVRMVGTPSLGLETCRGEILKMSQGVRKMMDWTKQLRSQSEPDEKLTEQVFHRERIMDNVQQEVIDFLSNLLTGEVSHAVTDECREQLRVADEYESISDYVSNVLKANLRMRQHDLSLSDDERRVLDELHDQVAAYLDLVAMGFEHRQEDILTRAETQGAAITQHVKDMREAHIGKLSKSKVDPIFSMSYNQTLNAYRKIKDHAINIAEALAPRS